MSQSTKLERFRGLAAQILGIVHVEVDFDFRQ